MKPTVARRFVAAQRRSAATAGGGPKVRFQPSLGHGVTPETMARWAPSMMIWGVAGGAFLIVAMSGVPIFQRDILYKIPGVKAYIESSKPPPEDQPF